MLASTFFFLISLASFSQPSRAYNWTIQQTPKQCSDMTISVSGDDGKPPYRVLIAPYGSPPWSNNTEVRQSFEQAFPGTESKVTFKMKYPGHSQFVAVVSDASGFASGGTSVATLVQDSDDSSCFDASKTVDLPWYFSTQPENQLVLCSNIRLYWNWNLTDHAAKGTPNFQGVIPGGQSFEIPRGPITDKDGYGTGFDWKPSLRDGTTVVLVAGDDRGNGTGGFTSYLVTQGSFPDRSCLNANSPSSTPGTPAGAVSTSVETSNKPTPKPSGGVNIGAIIAGVVGGVVFIIIMLLLFWWWRRKHRYQLAPRDVWLDDDDDNERRYKNGAQPNADLEHYRPEPFVLRPSTSTGVTGQDGAQDPRTSRFSDWRSSESHTTTTADPYMLQPTGSSSNHFAASMTSPTTASSGSKPGHRPSGSRAVVNVIQHQDAGPSHHEPPPEEHTIELPPAYGMLRGGTQAARPSREVREKPNGRRELVLHGPGS